MSKTSEMETTIRELRDGADLSQLLGTYLKGWLSVRNKDADESTSLAGTVTFGRERVGEEAFLT